MHGAMNERSSSSLRRRLDAPDEETGSATRAHASALTWTMTTQQVVALLARKWVIPILRELESGPKRRFQIRTAVKTVTPKVLTETLRSLERDGIIECVVHAEAYGPRGIGYQLTDLGASLSEPLDSLFVWGQAHLEDVHRSRRETDSSSAT